MTDVKELIKLKTENLKNEKEQKLKEIEQIEKTLEETAEIDKMTDDKDLFSKLSPIESMKIIQKLGVEGELDQREVVLNLINESLKESSLNIVEIPSEEKEGIEKMIGIQDAEELLPKKKA